MSHLKRRSLSTRLTSLAVLCTAVVAALSTEARAEEPAAVRTVPVIWSDFRIGLATPFPRESIARVVATQRALASQPPSRRCPAGTP